MIPERSLGTMSVTKDKCSLSSIRSQNCLLNSTGQYFRSTTCSGHHETTKSQEDFGTNEDFQAYNLLYLPNNCKGSPNGNSGILEKLCVQALKVLGSGNFPSLVCNLCDPPV